MLKATAGLDAIVPAHRRNPWPTLNIPCSRRFAPGSPAAVRAAARGGCSRAFSTCGRAARSAGSITPSPMPATGRRCSSFCIAGFVVVGCALVVEFKYEPPFWLHALLWVPLILATTLLPLRPMKGLMIALQYHHKAAEGRIEATPRNAAVNAGAQASGHARPGRCRARGPRCPARARHLADRTQGLEGGADRDARRSGSTTLRSALPPPAEWARHDAGEFGIPPRRSARRVSQRRAMRWSTPAARRCATTSKAPGYFVFTPARLPDGQQVVVNRGYVPDRSYPSIVRSAGHRRRTALAGGAVLVRRRPRCRGRRSGSCAISARWRSSRAGARSRRSTSSRRRRCRAGGLPHPARAQGAAAQRSPAICASPGTGSPPCWW